MQQVVDFILMGIKDGYDILNDFSITVYGFTFSMWDFLCALFILSCVVPLVVSPSSSGSFINVSRSIFRNSERNSKEKSDQKNSKR